MSRTHKPFKKNLQATTKLKTTKNNEKLVTFSGLTESDLRKIELRRKEVGWSRSKLISWSVYHFLECEQGFKAFQDKTIKELYELRQKRNHQKDDGTSP